MSLKKFLKKHGIQPQLRGPDHNVPSIGFSEKEQKWYGWSHRAIYGFSIGYTVKRGSCGFTADSPEDMIDDYANFFADISKECVEQHRAECQILDDRSGIRILHAPMMIPMAENHEEMAAAIEDGTTDELPLENIAPEFSIRKCGRGEWTAKTMKDAWQMACDFAEGVA